jgi:hypothetical protein
MKKFKNILAGSVHAEVPNDEKVMHLSIPQREQSVVLEPWE